MHKFKNLLLFLPHLVNFVWVFLTFAFFFPKGLFTYFNADTLYASVIFQDLIVDNTGLRGWNLNAAPNFFPDFFFYFLISFIVPNFKWAMMIYSVLQYAGMLLLLSWLLQRVNKNISWEYVTIANLLMLLFLLVGITGADYYFTYQIISVSYHLGPFILTILGLVLLSYQLEGPSKHSALLFFTVFLGALSNRLFLIMFTFPVFFSLLFFVKYEKTRVSKILAGIALSSILGLVVFWIIRQSGAITIISTGWKSFNFTNITFAMDVVRKQYTSFFKPFDIRGLIVVLSVLSYVINFKYAVLLIRKRLSLNPKGFHFEDVYILFFFFFFPGLLLLPILNGAYIGPAIIRYNIHVYYFAIFNLGFVFFRLAKKGFYYQKYLQFFVVLISIALLITGTILFVNKKSDFVAFSQYIPNYVACVDAFAERHQVQYGIAPYWNSKTTTMFSQQNVRLYQYFGNFRPYHHSTNRNWYYGTGKGKHANPEFRFVVISASDQDSLAIRELLGEPLLTEKCGTGLRVLLYPGFQFDPVKRAPFIVQEQY